MDVFSSIVRALLCAARHRRRRGRRQRPRSGWILRCRRARNDRRENGGAPPLPRDRAGQALRYPVAVGRQGKQWFGEAAVSGKHLRPAWSPPEEVRQDHPNLPSVIPGGAPNNPMGVAALTLSGGEYAIHGTNRPESIGKFVSYGCIRMHNRDIADLFGRVNVGTPVVVRP